MLNFNYNVKITYTCMSSSYEFLKTSIIEYEYSSEHFLNANEMFQVKHEIFPYN